MVKDMGVGVHEGEGAVETAVSCDALLGGRLRLRQPRLGYRAGLDAALLAAAVAPAPGQRALEAGCGPGAALLQAAWRHPGASFTGVERQADALALARDNIVLNGLETRVEALAGDVGRGFATLARTPFDIAFANPPYFDDPGALRAPHPARRAAWIADDGLEAWTRFLLKAVREGGRVLVIHRADRLGDLLGALGEGGGSFRIRPIHPFAEQPAKRVLVQVVKAGRAPLVLLPPLVLRHAAGPCDKAEAILRGEAALGWA